MKTITTKVYTASELKEQFPEAFERALKHHQEHNHEIAWQAEIIDSLKECCKHAGVKLKAWSLGAYRRVNHISFEMPGDDATSELCGKRAFAWLENNLFSALRIPWKGKERDSVRKFGAGYRPGLVKPCPLTGFCADEAYLDSLRKSIRKCCTLKEAFQRLADVCQTLLEDDCEAQKSEECFLEHADANEWQFEENGSHFN